MSFVEGCPLSFKRVPLYMQSEAHASKHNVHVHVSTTLSHSCNNLVTTLLMHRLVVVSRAKLQGWCVGGSMKL